MEVELDGRSKLVRGAVTRASKGSMSTYFGTLTKVANANVPKDAEVWIFAGDYSDHQLHVVRFGSIPNPVIFNLQLVP